MVTKRLLIGLLLIASTAGAAATNYYWDYPETTALESTDRLLVYKGTATDRNITGATLADSLLRKNGATGAIKFGPLATPSGLFNADSDYGQLLGYRIGIWNGQSGYAGFRLISNSTAAASMDTGYYDVAGNFSGIADMWLQPNGGNIIMGGYNTGGTDKLQVAGSILTTGLTSITNLNLNAAQYVKFGSSGAYDVPQQRLGVGTQTPTSPLQVVGLPTYGGATMAAANTAAKAAGLTVGAFFKYSTADSRVVGAVW